MGVYLCPEPCVGLLHIAFLSNLVVVTVGQTFWIPCKPNFNEAKVITSITLVSVKQRESTNVGGGERERDGKKSH